MAQVRFEGFEVLNELGRGAQGAVYEVRERATGAVLALKVLGTALEPDTVERFRREAEAPARLGGLGVVRVHRSGVDAGRLFFVMDLMRRGSLRERLRAERQLPWREAAEIAEKLARTLERAAALGLVHRDLKPSNVLFDEEGEPRIADFGCVRDLQRVSLTETGTVLGTPDYMAPEQLDGQKVDARADVFALGVTLHELLTGERPFRGSTPAQVFLAMKRTRREPARARSGCPERLDRLLDRMLALDPGVRATAAEAASELAAILAAPAAKKPGRRAVLAGVVVLWVLAVALAAWALAARGRAATPSRVGSGESVSPAPSARAPAAPTHPTVDESAEALALTARAEELVFQKRDADALVIAERASRLDPGLVLAWVVRATARRHGTDLDGARADVERALALSPDSVPALVERAKIYNYLARQRDKDDPTAFECFQQALDDASRARALEPASEQAIQEVAAALRARGFAHSARGEREEAIADLRRSLEVEPGGVMRSSAEGELRKLGER